MQVFLYKLNSVFVNVASGWEWASIVVCHEVLQQTDHVLMLFSPALQVKFSLMSVRLSVTALTKTKNAEFI